MAYFDEFNYPLTATELFTFLPSRLDNKIFTLTLSKLLAEGCIFIFDGFYTLKNEPQIAQYRQNGNDKATKLLKVAEKVGNLLIKFPYVRGLAISGSLSKNFADDNSDIDWFIITAANRLWIARTLLHLFKKTTFMFNKQHHFCMNYFVDEAGLQIEEKNIYTATEVVTLMPLQGDDVFSKFFSANAWTLNYLPNNFMRVAKSKPYKKRFLKSVFEFCFNNILGDIIDNLLRRITVSRWLNKTRHKKMNQRGVVMGMAEAKHFAKPDPKNYQQKLIKRYENKVDNLFRHLETELIQQL